MFSAYFKDIFQTEHEIFKKRWHKNIVENIKRFRTKWQQLRFWAMFPFFTGTSLAETSLAHSLIVEVKLLHEGIGHTVTCELKTGVLVGIGFAKSEGMNKNVAWAWMFLYIFSGVVRNGEQLLSSLTWNKNIL